MADDKVVNFNEHRIHKAVDDLENDEDILKFAQWVNEHVTKSFTITTDYGMNYEFKQKDKDIIREILKTMVNKNGYYTPPYE